MEDINWNEALAFGLSFGLFYGLGMYSGYEKARKKYRGY